MSDQPNTAGSASGNGSPGGAPAIAPPKKQVRSGLAQRRNPVIAGLGEFFGILRRTALRDPVALFLVIASIGLAIAFALLLGAIKPRSSGKEFR